MLKNELKIIKIDLDKEDIEDAIMELAERLEYVMRYNFINKSKIKKIELLHKTSYSVRILLNSELNSVESQVILQLLLGSDYRKEVNTLYNYLLGMEYYNRMFNVKRYPDGSYKQAEVMDITDSVLRIIKLLKDIKILFHKLDKLEKKIKKLSQSI